MEVGRNIRIVAESRLFEFERKIYMEEKFAKPAIGAKLQTVEPL